MVKKSKWILYFILLKIFIFNLIVISLFIWLLLVKFVYWYKDWFFLSDAFLFIMILLIAYTTISTIVLAYRFFYDFFILYNNKFYKFKMWLLGKEITEIIELYRIQEMSVSTNNFLYSILKIWHIILVEPKETAKFIRWIDKPSNVLMILEKIKSHVIKERWNIDNN